MKLNTLLLFGATVYGAVDEQLILTREGREAASPVKVAIIGMNRPSQLLLHQSLKTSQVPVPRAPRQHIIWLNSPAMQGFG